jgi:hypothetical protein
MQIITVRNRHGRARLVELDAEALIKRIQNMLKNDSLAKKLNAIAQMVEHDEITEPKDLEVLAKIRDALSRVSERTEDLRSQLREAIENAARDVTDAEITTKL